MSKLCAGESGRTEKKTKEASEAAPPKPYLHAYIEVPWFELRALCNVNTQLDVF